LLFRNGQLVKRVEALQKTLDEVNKLQAAKGKKKQKDANLRLFVDLSDQPANIAGSSVNAERRQILEQELERHVVEISELHSKIYDMEKFHEKLAKEFDERLTYFEEENTCLKQKLRDADKMQNSKKELIADDLPKLNGVCERKSIEGADEVLRFPAKENGTAKESPPLQQTSIELKPTNILSEHTDRLFKEANRAKAEWEGAVATLEHELDILRRWKDEQTNAADAINPEAKRIEKCLEDYFREKIKQLSVDLRFAKGETAYYKDECERALNVNASL